MKKTKRIISILIILTTIMISLAGCKKNNNNTNQTVSNNTVQEKVYTAEDIANALKEKSTNIGKIVVYTEETDDLSLLGRPNQYTSKVKFEDTRLQQFFDIDPDSEPIGGTIEVFSNEKDMQSRKEYLEYLTSSSTMFAQYMYANKIYILRLNYQLTPSQAKEYEDIFNQIIQ